MDDDAAAAERLGISGVHVRGGPVLVVVDDRAGHLPPRLVTTNLGPPGRCPRIQARINRLAAVVVLG